MGKFLVMDIVFYGGSLNYDQGTGNYQELKKITKWDGKQYTLVSRYALRYSLLETAKMMGLWEIADGDKLQLEGTGDQKVIQPSLEVLLSGEILKYPEFDLFGYLITNTKPQNFRESPVKVSHAISMTPFNYDALFNANIGLANRMRKRHGEMKPNPFTAEEHVTFYQYTIVVNLDNIGKSEVYLQVDKEKKKSNKKYKLTKVTIEEKRDSNRSYLEIIGEYSEKDKSSYQETLVRVPIIPEIKNIFKTIRYVLPVNEGNIKLNIKNEDLREILKYGGNDTTAVILIEYEIREDEVKKRINKLVQATLNLKRNIKGRDEDLSPKLMVVGIYRDCPYKTYKDRIFLKDEYCEEEYDEITEEPLENGRKIKVKHVVSKSKKPVFEIITDDIPELKETSEQEIIKFVSKLFKDDDENGNQKPKEGEKNQEVKELCEITVFHDPSVKIVVK